MVNKLKFILILLFVVLCSAHYFSQRPLWLDEDFIFKNIQARSYSEIFSPLDYAQAFPRVYLAAIKWLGGQFHYQVLALRFLPFLVMMGAFFLWTKLFSLRLKDQFLLIALLAFACSYRLVYYGGELKPYSMDVFAVALYALYCLRLGDFADQKPDLWLWIGAVLLPLTLFLSYAAILVFWISLFNLVSIIRKNRRFLNIALIHLLISAGAFSVFYHNDLKYSFHDPGLHHYWESYFISTASLTDFLESIFEGMKRLVVYWFGTEKWQYRLAVPLMPFFLYALFRYGIEKIKDKKGMVVQLESFMMVLMGELFLLGLLKTYPFTGERITLFLAPLVIFLIIKGLKDVYKIQRVGILRFFPLYYFVIYCLLCLTNTTIVIAKLYK